MLDSQAQLSDENDHHCLHRDENLHLVTRQLLR
jgi:hypothetical protein